MPNTKGYSKQWYQDHKELIIGRSRQNYIDNTKIRKTENKNHGIDYLGGKCKICSYNNCSEALDFHHIDPKTKEFGISQLLRQKSWDKIKKELDKCILLCCRCHRELHYKKEVI